MSNGFSSDPIGNGIYVESWWTSHESGWGAYEEGDPTSNRKSRGPGGTDRCIPADDPRVRPGGWIYERAVELGHATAGEPYNPAEPHAGGRGRRQRKEMKHDTR